MKQEEKVKRSKRFEKLDKMPVNKDGIIEEWNEAGLVTMISPNCSLTAS